MGVRVVLIYEKTFEFYVIKCISLGSQFADGTIFFGTEGVLAFAYIDVNSLFSLVLFFKGKMKAMTCFDN